MKPNISWVPWRILICVGLMWASKIPQGVVRFAIKAQQQKPDSDYFNGLFARFTEKDFETLEIRPESFLHYADSIRHHRQVLAEHEQYTQFLYFRDLAQFKMFEIKFRDSLNDLPGTQRMDIQVSLGGFGVVSHLQSICNSQKTFSRNDQEIAKARAYWLHDSPRDDVKINWWPEVVVPLLVWFFNFYVRGFPFALILFIIWKLKMKQDFDYAFKWEEKKPQHYFGIAPTSFLFSLLLWPIVLGIDIGNRFQEMLRRADVVSRRASLFTLFSKQDERLVQLGKRMNRKEFREHLDSLGMIQKHSFASALIVTLFLVIIPQSLFPHTTTQVKKDLVIMKKVDYGGGGISHAFDYIKKVEAIIVPQFEVFAEPLQKIFFVTDWVYENDFSPDIGKVPWLSMTLY